MLDGPESGAGRPEAQAPGKAAASGAVLYRRRRQAAGLRAGGPAGGDSQANSSVEMQLRVGYLQTVCMHA